MRHPHPPRLQLFSFRGKNFASVYLRGSVQAVAAVPQLGVADVTCWAVAVAGASQELRVYNESTLLSVTALKDHPSGLVPMLPPPLSFSCDARCRRCSAASEGRMRQRSSCTGAAHWLSRLGRAAVSARAPFAACGVSMQPHLIL